MAILKCKMCGGDIELSSDKTIGVCDSCGCTMTFPKVDDDQRANRFNRGNQFRRAGEFDKALAVYEQIVQEDENDAEAHWCCALCRFGIEYVEDPNTFEYLPTCHRASFDSFLEDVDYLAALEHSDGITRRQYQKDAQKIAEVQRGILATSQNEEPFDVFICYKESENDGRRTRDSLLAQEIYYQLTEQGRRVFFSRITLEDKAGTEYEPYIFAALNSAKVMIVVTTSAEHVNAVWVKNEWSRFLSLMRKDRSKLLLPCYRDMDPYDLPEALSVLQSYDMSKIGFIQDLIRGVNKVLNAQKPKETLRETVKETVVVQQQTNANAAPLLKRAFMFLEDGDFARADEFCEKVLNLDPENAEAYLGKLMAELHVKTRDALKDQPESFDSSRNYKKAIAFANDRIRELLSESTNFIQQRNRERQYQKNVILMNEAENGEPLFIKSKRYLNTAEEFDNLGDYKDSLQMAALCRERAESAAKDRIYYDAVSNMKIAEKDGASGEFYSQIVNDLRSIAKWRDSEEKISFCKRKISDLEEQARRKKKKKRTILLLSLAVTSFFIILAVLFSAIILPNQRYNEAAELYDEGQYAKAGILFSRIGSFKDAKQKSNDCWDKAAVRQSIAAGYWHTVGLKSDGTVVATGWNNLGQCDTSNWTNVVAVSVSSTHTVALKSNGTVYATGFNHEGQCNVASWKDIVSISAGSNHTIGLKKNGTVVAVGSNDANQCAVSEWEDIIAVAAGNQHTIGLKSDGTVVATGWNGLGQCDVSEWKDIIAIATNGNYSVGLKSNGTVVATGESGFTGYYDYLNWTDIISISVGGLHTIGLKSNGTVVAEGANGWGQSDILKWTDIISISAGGQHTIGLKSDGTVLAAGWNEFNQCAVDDWDSIQTYNP